MLHHLSLVVGDYERCKTFYAAALAPLGYSLCVESDGWAGFGTGAHPSLWLHSGSAVTRSLHIALRASSREAVDAFHAAALAAGGQDHGAPSLRPEYGEGYYAAYALDPDERNIEVVAINA